LNFNIVTWRHKDERRLSVGCTDWKKIKAKYLAGGTSYRKLAEEFGVPFGTLRRVAEREGWTQKRAQVAQKADTKMMETISEKNAEKASDIIDVADKLLAKLSELMDNVPLDTQSFKQLTSALKDLKDIKGYKSAIDLKEQEARIRNLEKQAEADSKQDNEIMVTIEGDLERYSK
jgi:transposase